MSEPYVDANSTVEMLVEISRGVPCLGNPSSTWQAPL